MATSSSFDSVLLPGSLIRTEDNKAGVTRPLARVSTIAHSLRYHSTDAFMVASALAYSCCAASSVIGCFELGRSVAVDLDLFFDA